MKSKDRLPAPEMLERDLEHLRTQIRRARGLTNELLEVYESAYDAGLSANGSGSLAIARNRFSPSDPTGDALVAKRQHQLRGACRRSLTATERAVDALSELENATVGLTSIFLGVDAKDLRRRRA